MQHPEVLDSAVYESELTMFGHDHDVREGSVQRYEHHPQAEELLGYEADGETCSGDIRLKLNPDWSNPGEGEDTESSGVEPGPNYATLSFSLSEGCRLNA